MSTLKETGLWRGQESRDTLEVPSAPCSLSVQPCQYCTISTHLECHRLKFKSQALRDSLDLTSPVVTVYRPWDQGLPLCDDNCESQAANQMTALSILLAEDPFPSGLCRTFRVPFLPCREGPGRSLACGKQWPISTHRLFLRQDLTVESRLP